MCVLPSQSENCRQGVFRYFVSAVGFVSTLFYDMTWKFRYSMCCFSSSFGQAQWGQGARPVAQGARGQGPGAVGPGNQGARQGQGHRPDPGIAQFQSLKLSNTELLKMGP